MREKFATPRTRGTDEHVDLGASRDLEMARDNLDSEIRKCSECDEDELCAEHTRAWKAVYGSEPE